MSNSLTTPRIVQFRELNIGDEAMVATSARPVPPPKEGLDTSKLTVLQLGEYGENVVGRQIPGLYSITKVAKDRARLDFSQDTAIIVLIGEDANVVRIVHDYMIREDVNLHAAMKKAGAGPRYSLAYEDAHRQAFNSQHAAALAATMYKGYAAVGDLAPGTKFYLPLLDRTADQTEHDGIFALNLNLGDNVSNLKDPGSLVECLKAKDNDALVDAGSLGWMEIRTNPGAYVLVDEGTPGQVVETREEILDKMDSTESSREDKAPQPVMTRFGPIVRDLSPDPILSKDQAEEINRAINMTAPGPCSSELKVVPAEFDPNEAKEGQLLLVQLTVRRRPQKDNAADSRGSNEEDLLPSPGTNTYGDVLDITTLQDAHRGIRQFAGGVRAPSAAVSSPAADMPVEARIARTIDLHPNLLKAFDPKHQGIPMTCGTHSLLEMVMVPFGALAVGETFWARDMNHVAAKAATPQIHPVQLDERRDNGYVQCVSHENNLLVVQEEIRATIQQFMKDDDLVLVPAGTIVHLTDAHVAMIQRAVERLRTDDYSKKGTVQSTGDAGEVTAEDPDAVEVNGDSDPSTYKSAEGDYLDSHIMYDLRANFSDALHLMVKKGLPVRRDTWPEGHGVFLEMGSYDWHVGDNGPVGPCSIRNIPSSLFENGDHGTSTRLPNFRYFENAEGGRDSISYRGWTPTTEDMLATNWLVIKKA